MTVLAENQIKCQTHGIRKKKVAWAGAHAGVFDRFQYRMSSFAISFDLNTHIVSCSVRAQRS